MSIVKELGAGYAQQLEHCEYDGAFKKIVSVQLDGRQLRLEPGQTVIPHGPDRNLTVAEAYARR